MKILGDYVSAPCDKKLGYHWLYLFDYIYFILWLYLFFYIIFIYFYPSTIIHNINVQELQR